MGSEHVVDIEPVKAYLLGKLDDQAVARLEVEYFTNRSFFLDVQAAEFILIEDYLRGRLDRSDRQRFEQRYLVVPELRRRLEEVRQRRGLAMPLPLARAGFVWSRALAAAVVVAVGLGAWIYWSGRGASHPQPAAGAPAVQMPVFSMHLSPGLQKGGDSGDAAFSVPGSAAILRLTLEFPGRAAAFDCSAKVYLAGDNGERTLIWESTRSVSSVPTSGGQVAAFDIPAASLRRGDYIVEAGGAQGAIRETYTFRAM